MIERAKTEADDGLQDILDKWWQANERILEKYPEGSQMSFAQLEEAARNSIENIEEEKKAAGAKGKRSTNKQGLPPRDDEMQVYLSEIR